MQNYQLVSNLEVIYASSLGCLCVLYSLLLRLFTSVQLVNTCVKTRLDTAEGPEVYSLSESPFCLLQEEVRTLQHFTFHACN